MMRAAVLAQTADAEEHINTFVTNPGHLIDAQQDEIDLRVSLLKRGNHPQQEPPCKTGGHANLELPVRYLSIGAEPVGRLFDFPQNLNSVAMEAQALARQLQRTRRPRE